MKKVFISQPMRGRSNEEILNERELLIAKAKERFGEIEILDTFFKDFDGNALAFLGRAINILSQADIALFGNGWENARGCAIEHECALKYGIEIITLVGD